MVAVAAADERSKDKSTQRSSSNCEVYLEIRESLHLNEMLFDTFERDHIGEIVKANPDIYGAKRIIGKTDKVPFS